MKIQLNSEQARREITSVRSQITDSTNLKKFDDFIAKNDKFDFNNDQHLQALRKQDCHCTVTVSVPISGL